MWGGRADCGHEWGEGGPGRSRDRQHVSEAPGARGGGLKASAKNHSTPGGDSFCRKCGAWRGELGQEPMPALFVEHLVVVFRVVRRVMRPDATLWLNMGDSYGSGGTSTNRAPRILGEGGCHSWTKREQSTARSAVGEIKPKDLCEIPSDVVRALRADGWWLRSRIPWLKRNAMPESTNDRPTQAVEYVFLLSKSARYFYDGEAVKVRSAYPDDLRRPLGSEGAWQLDGRKRGSQGGGKPYDHDASRRARRNSDWFFESWQGLYADDDPNPDGEGGASGSPLAFVVNPAAFKQAHFATFPPKLVEPMVKVGTSVKGCCPRCGKPWERVVERTANPSKAANAGGEDLTCGAPNMGGNRQTSKGLHRNDGNANTGEPVRTLGWRPGCACYSIQWAAAIEEEWPRLPRTRNGRKRKGQDAWTRREKRARAYADRCVVPRRHAEFEAEPCTVLDPFSGAGTTAMVAAQLGRRAIGIDLSEKYNRMAAARIGKALRPATFVDQDAGTEMSLLASTAKPGGPAEKEPTLPLGALRGFTDG